MKDFLESKGASFPEGAQASYTPRSKILTVRNTLSNLDRVDQLIHETLTIKKRNDLSQEQQILLTKLQTIIIPKVSFEDTPLPEAIAFLQKQSRELDTSEQIAGTPKGVNFLLAIEEDPGHIGTLHLINIPLETALKYIVDITGLEYSVEENAVVIHKGKKE